MRDGLIMNIVTCVKQVPDTNLPIKLDYNHGLVDPDDMIHIINPCDRVAVEEAVRIKEKGGGKVTLISFGISDVERSLKKCLALGADDAILILDHLFQFDSHVTSSVLAKAIGTLDYDLILCGNRAKDMEMGGGQCGPRIAALLGLPFVTNVDHIKISDDGKIATVHQKIERGNKNIIECPMPSLFTVSETINTPRYPSFPASLSAIQSEVQKFTLEDIGLHENDLNPMIKIINLIPPKPRQKRIFTLDSSLPAEERIKLMLSGDPSKEKKGDFIEGSPDKLVDSIFEFLNELKMI